MLVEFGGVGSGLLMELCCFGDLGKGKGSCSSAFLCLLAEGREGSSWGTVGEENISRSFDEGDDVGVQMTWENKKKERIGWRDAVRDIGGDIIYLALYFPLSDRIETGKREKGKHYLLTAGCLACGDSPQSAQRGDSQSHSKWRHRLLTGRD